MENCKVCQRNNETNQYGMCERCGVVIEAYGIPEVLERIAAYLRQCEQEE